MSTSKGYKQRFDCRFKLCIFNKLFVFGRFGSRLIFLRFFESCVEFLIIKRFTEKIALNAVTSAFAEIIELFFNFNALCNNKEVHIMCERNNRADYFLFGFRTVYAIDKRFVDFKCVDRKRTEIMERRIARSEIVKCD